jgi:hypothetical protein
LPPISLDNKATNVSFVIAVKFVVYNKDTAATKNT